MFWSGSKRPLDAETNRYIKNIIHVCKHTWRGPGFAEHVVNEGDEDGKGGAVDRQDGWMKAGQ